MQFSILDINHILGGIKNLGCININTVRFDNISIDSRTVVKSDLFIAIKGKFFNGHDFLSEVANKGIKAVVIEKGMQKLVPYDIPYWEVNNTLEAFQKLTLYKRKKLGIPVIAVTGSVGKTTTKEMIGEVLKKFGEIKLSSANFNNEIGVGLTILGTDFKDKILVLEMGMRGLGQIENLSKYSEPDIAVITNIGSAHIGILGSKEKITYAKCEITKYLNPNGLVIIPANDKFLEETLKINWKGRIVKVELSETDLVDKNLKKNNYIRGFYNKTKNSISIENKIFEISFAGFHNASNFMFAYAVAKEFGINFEKLNKFNFKSSIGRNRIIKSFKTTIYDESYNASPESTKACIETLLQRPRNKFLVFGSMQELGDKSKSYHESLFDLINKSDIKKCLFICDKDEEIYYLNYLKDSKKFLFLNDTKYIAEKINQFTKRGDSILIKGSRCWQLEKIIKLIY